MKVCTSKKITEMHVSPRSTCDHKQNQVWNHCGHGKERQKKNKARKNNNKQTDKQTNEKEQDKYKYKNKKLQCKYNLISGPLFTIPCQKDPSCS